jgi:hypothetical protein
LNFFVFFREKKAKTMFNSNQKSYYSESECTRSWNEDADIANEIDKILMDDNDNYTLSSLNCYSLPQLQFKPMENNNILEDALFSENSDISCLSDFLNEIENLMKNGEDDVQVGVEDVSSLNTQLPDQSLFTNKSSLMTAEQYEKYMKRALKSKRSNETKLKNKRLKKDTKNVK